MSRRRKSIRLPEYDYSTPGAYFITIVTHQRERLFGEIVDGEMRLNNAGKIIQEEWIRSRKIRAPWEFNDYIVMPDHFHGIVEICEMDTVGAHSCAPLRKMKGQRLYRQPRSLGSFVAGFKAACTTRINILRISPGQSIWQRNYYEHVIRDDNDLDAITAYISGNPSCWKTDDPFQTPIRFNTRRIITSHKS
jgi:putative transposase